MPGNNLVWIIFRVIFNSFHFDKTCLFLTTKCPHPLKKKLSDKKTDCVLLKKTLDGCAWRDVDFKHCSIMCENFFDCHFFTPQKHWCCCFYKIKTNWGDVIVTKATFSTSTHACTTQTLTTLTASSQTWTIEKEQRQGIFFWSMRKLFFLRFNRH